MFFSDTNLVRSTNEGLISKTMDFNSLMNTTLTAYSHVTPLRNELATFAPCMPNKPKKKTPKKNPPKTIGA